MSKEDTQDTEVAPRYVTGAVNHDVRDCSSCGRDHGAMPFKRLRRPLEHDDGTWTHVGECPDSKDPVLMRFIAEG
jgi:hypothetical protein